MSDRSICFEDESEIICKPLDTLQHIAAFLEDPPVWRTLCKGRKPHSKRLIRNIEVNSCYEEICLELPQTFCHFDPDVEDVNRHDEKTLPKTLVCHDMANGYRDDSIIDGTGKYDAYTFYNWAGIDIFCYFSHHLVTIPPLGWINVGHAHGVKVIGTLITEWSEGSSFWETVLASEEKIQNTVSSLVAIAKTLKFDGWLLNVENKVTEPEKLLQFVRYFHQLLHQELDDPVLIWYDSVTVDGHLNWQNSLNGKNKAFFDACDGLFTNYSWTTENVEESVQVAGNRVTDLYIGIDVWGRNFHGGGQFNTQQAIKVAHSRGCSLAIFAPAWTHEAVDATDAKHKYQSNIMLSEHLTRYEKFLLRDRALWDSIWPFLNTRVPSVLPFQTSFCRGQGKKRRLYGEVLCPVTWYNLRHMQYQPNSAHGPHGYLLSTQSNLSTISTHALHSTSAKGILMLRQSLFDLHKLESHHDESFRNTSIDGDTTQHSRTAIVERINMKQRIRDSLRNLFRKCPRIESDTRQGNKSATNLRGMLSYATLSVSINLGQATMPTRFALAWVAEERDCLETYFDDSFVGGSCLKINPSDEVSTEHRSIRLFHTDFNSEHGLVVCVATKTVPGFDNQWLNVILHGRAQGGQGGQGGQARPFRRTLVGRPVAQGSSEDVLSPLAAHTEQFQELQKHLVLNEPAFYVPVENSYGWSVRYYEIDVPGVCVTSINCRTGLPKGPVLLGHIGICRWDKDMAEVATSRGSTPVKSRVIQPKKVDAAVEAKLRQTTTLRSTKQPAPAPAPAPRAAEGAPRPCRCGAAMACLPRSPAPEPARDKDDKPDEPK